jgi:hypothetical protein
MLIITELMNLKIAMFTFSELPPILFAIHKDGSMRSFKRKINLGLNCKVVIRPLNDLSEKIVIVLY